MKFVREAESSRKLYESFCKSKETNEAQNLQVSKLKIIETQTYQHYFILNLQTFP